MADDPTEQIARRVVELLKQEKKPGLLEGVIEDLTPDDDGALPLRGIGLIVGGTLLAGLLSIPMCNPRHDQYRFQGSYRINSRLDFNQSSIRADPVYQTLISRGMSHEKAYSIVQESRER